jgi:hypothetical protein
MQLAALFMLAAWMGRESLTLPALVLVLCMLVLFMYPFWRWWRTRRSAKVIAKVFADLDAGKFDRSRDTEAGLAYVKDHGQPRQLTQPADLRGQLAAVAPGFAITITYVGSRAAGKCSGLPRV